MKIPTTRFGEIEFPDDKIIELPEGLLGFESAHRYVLLEHDSEGTPFKWFQSVDNPDLAFIVMDPHLVIDGYRIEIDDETAKSIGASDLSPEDFAMMAIVNIPHEDPANMTVNLRAPILVHLSRRVGWQIILPDENYPIRHRLFPEAGQEKSGSAR